MFLAAVPKPSTPSANVEQSDFPAIGLAQSESPMTPESKQPKKRNRKKNKGVSDMPEDNPSAGSPLSTIQTTPNQNLEQDNSSMSIFMSLIFPDYNISLHTLQFDYHCIGLPISHG